MDSMPLCCSLQYSPANFLDRNATKNNGNDTANKSQLLPHRKTTKNSNQLSDNAKKA